MTETSLTLAELVSTQPAAARVLHRLRLDFCCGGRRSLAEACAERGLEVDRVLTEIAAERPASDDDVEQLSSGELTDYIVTRFHEPLRRELPRLCELAKKVERVHRDKPECPRGLAAHLDEVHNAILSHLAKEEQILFPLIQSGRAHLAQMPVRVMIQEHDDHAANLQRTRDLTGDLEIPLVACTSWRALYTGLLELELELMKHIHLENNVLFPAVLHG
ncbi:MAG TPA: iron-sulfur cluster repair di-iron protein [Candidatus Acidoferrales bacterium]|nr:iron-sulfur cluster repair di-iron protein [Candidatus Acidoferrales bacterium]